MVLGITFLTLNNNQMRILVACEESQEVAKAFRALGHQAYSCDILPASGGHPEWHIQDDVLRVLDQTYWYWDVLIAFPPCTYLCSSGLHWNKRRPERAEQTEEALKFVSKLMSYPIKYKALENPIGCISTRIYRQPDGAYHVCNINIELPNYRRVKPDQIIQPYQFGHDASKSTCLYLQNLPKLVPTEHVAPRVVNGKKRWGNQTDSGQNKLGPCDERASLRSKTYPGIAKAMAEQWSEFLSFKI